MEAPRIAPCPFSRLTWIWTNFPKREEFLLRTVSAFPKASSNGLVITSREPNSIDDLRDDFASTFASLVTNARWRRTSLHVSVLPEPDGPETTMACRKTKVHGDASAGAWKGEMGGVGTGAKKGIASAARRRVGGRGEEQEGGEGESGERESRHGGIGWRMHIQNRDSRGGLGTEAVEYVVRIGGGEMRDAGGIGSPRGRGLPGSRPEI